MRASRRTVPWVRVAAPAGACRRLAALACKVRNNLLAYTMVPRLCEGILCRRPWIKRRDRSNIAVRSLLLCSFCSAVNSHRSTAAAARSRHQSTLARDQTYAPVRYIARAHPSIPQGKSSTGILAPAAYNESPIVAFQLAAAKSPLTCFTDPLPEEGSRSAPIANRLWAPRAGPMVRIHFPPAKSQERTCLVAISFSIPHSRP
jgi:hypothetical protein